MDGSLLGMLPDKSSNYALIWQPQGMVLSEASFCRLVLEMKLSFQQISRLISRRVALRSWKAYPQFQTQLRQLHSARLVEAQKGNRNGARQPSVRLSETKLVQMVQRGIPLERMAKLFKTTPFLVRRNMQIYGLQKLGNAPVKARILTEHQIVEIDRMCPGLSAAFSGYSTDKAKFFRTAYAAFLKLLNQAWFLKDMCQMPFTRFKEDRGGLEEISWSMNRHELYLSQELLAAEIPHYREYVYSGNLRADFALIGTSLLVEVDGEYHTEAQDRKNTAVMNRLGYQVLRFTTKQVQFSMPEVLQKIRTALKQSSASNPLVCRQSGTLKSKKITAT